MNRAPSFATDYFHNARMRVAERVYGDAAKKIQILFSSRIENVRAAAVSHDHGLALIGRQKELLGIRQASVRRSSFRRPTFDLAERAACAADKGSRRTRVPGIKATPSLAEASAACDASNRASDEVPPTMRTSRTPPSMARLAASSLRTMPPETTRHGTKRSISSHVTAERTRSPSRTPATSVR